MLNTNIFRAIADLAMGAEAKRAAEYQAFLKFYRELVETLPAEAVRLFGSCPRKVTTKSGKEESWNIQLSVTDFIFWKMKIENEGARFTNGPAVAQTAMLKHLSEKADAVCLEPEQRKTLLALLDASPEPA